jgi:hypothetical protein
MQMLGFARPRSNSLPFSTVQVSSVLQLPTSVGSFDCTRQMVCAQGWSAQGTLSPRHWHATGAGSTLGRHSALPAVPAAPTVPLVPPRASAPAVETFPPVCLPPVAMDPPVEVPPVGEDPPVRADPPVAAPPIATIPPAAPLELVLPELAARLPPVPPSKLTEPSEHPRIRTRSATTRRIQKDYHHRSQVQ